MARSFVGPLTSSEYCRVSANKYDVYSYDETDSPSATATGNEETLQDSEQANEQEGDEQVLPEVDREAEDEDNLWADYEEPPQPSRFQELLDHVQRENRDFSFDEENFRWAVTVGEFIYVPEEPSTVYDEQGIQTSPEVVDRGVQTDLTAYHTSEDVSRLTEDLDSRFWDSTLSDFDEKEATPSDPSAEANEYSEADDDYRVPGQF